jgi:Flp pilus assembly pilin Flp
MGISIVIVAAVNSLGSGLNSRFTSISSSLK